ncbi:hypothetical protein ACFFV7_12920 [Nonomuraea spiralis]|uniref:Uncharacterized protein n=1 Tax=Nonomuraea spiralis TaxID=46182 RepID=A0ABV5IC26_9ACTN|nr:hypothetical protein [Nonomuraea spiralis]
MAAIPLIAAGLLYGPRTTPSGVDWAAAAALAGTAVLIGVLAGSRISPVASLLPGLAFSALAGATIVRVVTGGDRRMGFDLVPADYLDAYAALLNTWSFVIGGILLTASVFPSRWRARQGKAPAPEGEEPPPLPKRVPFASKRITSARPAPGPATGR